jgi:hypothetical protein
MWIVLSIVGGLVVLCGCCVGVPGAIYLANKDKINAVVGAQITAEQFLQHVSAGNTDSAYDLTSKAFQNRMSKQQFKSFVEKTSGLRNQRGHQVQMDPNSVTSNSATLAGSISTSSGSTLACTLKMVKEGDQWRVDDFTAK